MLSKLFCVRLRDGSSWTIILIQLLVAKWQTRPNLMAWDALNALKSIYDIQRFGMTEPEVVWGLGAEGT